MAEPSTFPQIASETVATVRARIDSDLNAGKDPGDPTFIDTTEGGIWYDFTQPLVLEIARMWDSLAREIPAAVMLPFSWGAYLDEWGVTLDVGRKAAVKSTGTITFTAGAATDGITPTLISAGTQVGVAESQDPSDPTVFNEPVTFTTLANAAIAPAGGTVDVAIEAATAGSHGNVAAGSIAQLLTPVLNVTAISNAAGTSGGDDVEADDAYRERLLLELSSPQGSGTRADYQRWALAFPGVGYATVEELWAGNGTVRVIVTDPSNLPVSPTVINGLQAQLDPNPGHGDGLAPIGHTVTVATPALATVGVSANIAFETGYSLLGTGGTIASRSSIEAAIEDYVNTLRPGDDVVLSKVSAAIVSVVGVTDVSGVTLTATVPNLTPPPPTTTITPLASGNIPVTPLQVARIGTITLS